MNRERMVFNLQIELDVENGLSRCARRGTGEFRLYAEGGARAGSRGATSNGGNAGVSASKRVST